MTKAEALKAPTGISRGLNKGFVVSKIAAKKTPVSQKGRKTRYNTIVRSVVRDTVGFTTYERRIMEMLKGGGSNPQKRAYKYAKQRLGAHLRAKRKVAEMDGVLARAK